MDEGKAIKIALAADHRIFRNKPYCVECGEGEALFSTADSYSYSTPWWCCNTCDECWDVTEKDAIVKEYPKMLARSKIKRG